MAREQEKKQSRRARRRAERQGADEQPESGEDIAAGDAADEGDEEAAASASEEEDEPPASAPPAARSGGKRKKKRRAEPAAEDGEGSVEEIKDRNRRMRAAAAARRRAKREKERRVAEARGLDASELVDDALARSTHAATKWIKKNFTIVQWAVVALIAGGIGWQIYSWRHERNIEKASDVLAEAVDAELGRVGDEAPPIGQEELLSGPTFATHEARLEAAAKEYEEAASGNGSGTAILARLGLAGVRYDQGKFDDALRLYEEVKTSKLAAHDSDVALRATEGIGLTHEAKGELDKALASFKELEGKDAQGFDALSLYHQARIAFSKKDKEGAKKLLEKAQEKLDKDKAMYPAGSYIERATRDLMAMIDPSKARPSSMADYTPEQMEALKAQIMQDPTKLENMLKDMQKQVKDITNDLPKPEDIPQPAPSGAP